MDQSKQISDYILVSKNIMNNISLIMVDEIGSLRIKGKKETDHNTITLDMKINDRRKTTYMEKWCLSKTKGPILFRVPREIHLRAHKT